MKKIIAFGAILLVAALLVVGCDKGSSSTGPSKYESLNLVKVENWVILEAHLRDQKILNREWSYLRETWVSIEWNLGNMEKYMSSYQKQGLSKRELHEKAMLLAGTYRHGLIITGEDPSYYYDIYVAIKEGMSLEEARLVFLTEGRFMFSSTKDSLEAHGYFKGIEKLAKSSAY